MTLTSKPARSARTRAMNSPLSLAPGFSRVFERAKNVFNRFSGFVRGTRDPGLRRPPRTLAGELF